MPLWPAVKLMDSVIGLDVHTVIIPPAPPAPLPHPYFGAILLWNTPQFALPGGTVDQSGGASIRGTLPDNQREIQLALKWMF